MENFCKKENFNIKWNSSDWGQGHCFKHEDKNPSLFINRTTGQMHCKGCNYRASIFDFYMERHSVDFKTALQALAEAAGLNPEIQKRIVKAYDYVDKSGNLIFQTVRYAPKDFKQRRPDPVNQGKWIYNLKGISLILYNFPEVLKAQSVIVVEGEKDVETLRSIGLVGTCNPLGAGKWRSGYSWNFKDKEIVILPDNDAPGKQHAEAVAKSFKDIATSVKVIELPGLPDGGDVTDWLQGHTKEELLEIIRQTPEWSKVQPLYSGTIGLLDSLLKWNDILTLDIQTEYILDKLIPKGSITQLFGRGGIGKTSLCLQIARAVAEGLPFADLQTIKTPVYFIDFENPLSVLKERVTYIGNTENVYIWHISGNPMPPRLDTKEWELYKELPAGLLIFDTLRAAHLSDENNSKDMAIVIARLKELREAGFTILLLHHTPKGNEGIYKGSTALLDLVDHVLSLESVKDTENESIEFDKDNLYRLGVRIKTRYEPYHIFLKFNPEIKGFELAKDPSIEVLEAIHELLEDKEELNTNQIYELVKTELDIRSKGQVLNLLRKGEGKYWSIDTRGRAKYYRSYSPAIYSPDYRTIEENNPDNSPEISEGKPSQSLDNSIESNSPNNNQTNGLNEEDNIFMVSELSS